jgi:hypothetical protein
MKRMRSGCRHSRSGEEFWRGDGRSSEFFAGELQPSPEDHNFDHAMPHEDGPDIEDVLGSLPARSQHAAQNPPFAFDRVMFSGCPKMKGSTEGRGRRSTKLNSTNIGQLILKHLYGVTKRQMTAIITLLKWRGTEGEIMFRTEDLVNYNVLSDLAEQLPLLPIYVHVPQGSGNND